MNVGVCNNNNTLEEEGNGFDEERILFCIVAPSDERLFSHIALSATFPDFVALIADKSMYWCRNFAFITGVFGGSECLVEKYRGKHDVWNSVASGCITGAALQAKQGPQAAAMGCGGFAAFSLVIDSFMGHY